MATAQELFSTVAAIRAPCSVKAQGGYLLCWPRPGVKIAFCDLKAWRFSLSSLVKRNMKSAGNRSWLRSDPVSGDPVPGREPLGQGHLVCEPHILL